MSVFSLQTRVARLEAASGGTMGLDRDAMLAQLDALTGRIGRVEDMDPTAGSPALQALTRELQALHRRITQG